MATTTTNFSLIKPDVASPTDADIWGTQTNTNWDSVDGFLLTARDHVIRSESSSPVSTSVTDRNKLLLIDATSGAITLNLVAAATAGDGFTILIKKANDSSNTVTIDGNSTETIDGALTLVLTAINQSVTLVCDGTNWRVIDKTNFGSLQTVSTFDTSSGTQAATGSSVNLSGLDTNITTSNTTSNIKIDLSLGTSFIGAAADGALTIVLKRDSTTIATWSRAVQYSSSGSGGNGDRKPWSAFFIDTPASAATITYSLEISDPLTSSRVNVDSASNHLRSMILKEFN